jgi:hypothetical protein
MWPEGRVRPLLIASLLVAACSFLSVYLFPNDFGLWGSLLLAGLWVVLLGVGLVRFRWKGLWLLLGAPVALYSPWVVWMIIRACHQNSNACP